jgi:hypothetical protein
MPTGRNESENTKKSKNPWTNPESKSIVHRAHPHLVPADVAFLAVPAAAGAMALTSHRCPCARCHLIWGRRWCRLAYLDPKVVDDGGHGI